MTVLDLLLGRPLASDEARAECVGPAAGIPIFGLDARSSAAYGPEAALTLLIPLGAAGIAYMVPISASIILCVFRHGPSLLALSPKKFLLPASSGTLFTIFFHTSQLPGASCYLLCSAASPQHTSTSALRSIQFA
jgi:hypothetical protein